MAALNFPFDDTLRHRIRTNLETFERRAVRAEGLTRAAVALVIVPGNGVPGSEDAGAAGAHPEQAASPDEACFVITRRAAKLRRHSGQWALPGGRLDDGETAQQAALREVQEEVALELEPDRVLGTLDDYPTRSGFVITPFVVWAPTDAFMTPDPVEVASIHRVRLAELDQPDVPHLRTIPESSREVISIPMLGTNIHAPTAAMLYQLLEVGLRGNSTRVDRYEQPVFAWR